MKLQLQFESKEALELFVNRCVAAGLLTPRGEWQLVNYYSDLCYIKTTRDFVEGQTPQNINIMKEPKHA